MNCINSITCDVSDQRHHVTSSLISTCYGSYSEERTYLQCDGRRAIGYPWIKKARFGNATASGFPEQALSKRTLQLSLTITKVEQMPGGVSLHLLHPNSPLEQPYPSQIPLSRIDKLAPPMSYVCTPLVFSTSGCFV